MLYLCIRTSACLATVIALIGCQDTVGPVTSLTLAADLPDTHQVLFMTVGQQGTAISGTARLDELKTVGSESMTVAGTRTADTITVTFQRASKTPFTFSGWYVSAGTVLKGTLNGAEFDHVAASFTYK
ncbi:MAG: hypothetical protein ABJE47_04205 [bacterium]